MVIALSLSFALAGTARGVVFHDVDGDGVRDPGEPGLPDVGVSNGRDIVRTNRSGRYRLRVGNDTTVFVLKPRGFRTPIDEELQLPRFYYTHKPQGSPDLKFPGVPPTGRLPRSIDFALTEHEEPERFEVILFGDPQPRDQAEIDYLAHDVVEGLVGSDAAFGVTLGDILFDDLSLFGALNRTIAMIGIPWYNVLGNHDINFDAPDDALSDETFERHYGPPYYAFDHGPVHFLVLDDVHWKGRVEGEGYHGGNYTGGLGEDQLAFVRNDLASIPRDQLVVLFMHIPLTSGWQEPERQALFRLMEERPLALSISAHHHFQEHVWLDADDGWKGSEPHHHVVTVTTSGSWWRGLPDATGVPVTTMRDGAPNGHLVVTFDGSDYAMDFRAARGSANEQMHIWVPERVYARRAHLTEVLVNVYNGSEKTDVRFRVDGEGEWRSMTQTARPDPLYEAVKDEEIDAMPDRWKLPEAIDSPHLWSGILPKGLGAGRHLVEVKVTDPWGATFEERRSFRIK